MSHTLEHSNQQRQQAEIARQTARIEAQKTLIATREAQTATTTNRQPQSKSAKPKPITTTESCDKVGYASLPALPLDDAVSLTPVILTVFATAYTFRNLVRFIRSRD